MPASNDRCAVVVWSVIVGSIIHPAMRSTRSRERIAMRTIAEYCAEFRLGLLKVRRASTPERTRLGASGADHAYYVELCNGENIYRGYFRFYSPDLGWSALPRVAIRWHSVERVAEEDGSPSLPPDLANLPDDLSAN
jgi:hypothetical protein